MRARFLPTLGLALLAAACGSSAAPANGAAALTVDNPTGACKAPDDGARAGFHDPTGAQWLLDCKNPLAREYWRVFAYDAASAYIIPRPDGAPELQQPCADATDRLHAVVERYALCAPAASAEDLARMNDLTPADALAVTHHLHGALRFVVGGGVGITPFPIPSDILDACALHPQTNSAGLTTLCERERQRGGQDTGFTYEGPGAVELVSLLNELYGIH